jgi:uncharacterized membrane protein
MKSANRLLYLDWMRGLAAVVMLQGHVFQSFTRADLRAGGPYMFSQFLGGMPPAVFLFLTGITLAFLMDSHERKNMPAGSRWKSALGRARYLFLLAIAFRIQLWVFSRVFSSAHNPWQEMLKVDILNCMGFGIALLSVMAVFKTTERIRFCAILGVAIALLAPLVTQAAPWIGPPLLRSYLVPSLNEFGFFPWAAFIAFGMSAGSLLRQMEGRDVTKTMQWFALAGVGLAFGASTLSSTGPSVYLKSDYWLDGPGLIFVKLGVLLIVVAFSYVWMMQPSAQGWSWVRQLGTTSLLVYWVHIELVYGHWLGWLKNNLDVSQTILAAASVTALMVLLGYVKNSWPKWKEALAGAFATPEPDRVSGD